MKMGLTKEQKEKKPGMNETIRKLNKLKPPKENKNRSSKMK